MKIQKDISLAQYASFRTGGRARYFAAVKTISDLKQGVNFASSYFCKRTRQNSLPIFILGGGSNILILTTPCKISFYVL